MVVDDQLYWMYSSDSARIIDVQGQLVSDIVTHIAADSFRGGSQLMPLNNGWLGIIHESHTMPDNRRRYMHRFVWYDAFGRLNKYSEAFYLVNLGIEFAAGLARQPGTDCVIVSFGAADRDSRLAIFQLREILKILKPAGTVLDRFGNQDTAWVLAQTNRPLQSQEQVDRATHIAMRCGVKNHEDQAKNWDSLIALWYASMYCDPALPVMDVAATEGSSVLPALAGMGYQNLISINIDEPNPRTVDGVSYQVGDCTGTDFPEAYFGFISCLSVVEHGVDIDAFFKESYRILRPGGVLVVSTDYWQDPVETYGQQAFGVPVKVMDMNDIARFIQVASSYGLEITTNVSMQCQDRVVNWIGMDYTFINLVFKKPK